ncbi:MAG: DUF6249 domain-containing protein [Bacteroidaceae bacterium]|jgi:uncharacterized membrane protein|nr:DUF6249 domain-containing protein [Bacteroidaceae bacterium]
MKKQKMIKVTHILLLLTVAFCFLQNVSADKAPTHHSTAITAVSDTTDSAVDSPDTAATTTMTHLPTTKIDLTTNPFKFFDMGGGAFILLNLFLISLIFLVPLGFFILVIYLIVRRNRRKKREEEPTPTIIYQNGPMPIGGYPEQTKRMLEKNKDRAILHMGLGIGVFVVSLLFHIKICIAIGIVLFCYGSSEFTNARRHLRERNNDQSKK